MPSGRNRQSPWAKLRPRMARCRLPWYIVAVAAALAGLAPRAAWAHDEAVSSSDVEILGTQVTWKVDVGLAGLAKALHLPVAEGAIDESALNLAAPAMGRYLSQGVQVRVDGVALPATVGPSQPLYEPAITDGRPVLARVSQRLSFTSQSPLRACTAKVSFFADLTSQHRALVRVSWGAEVRRYMRLGSGTLDLAPGQPAHSAWSTAREFLAWGVHHIFLGYDHIAFLLALLLAVTRLADLLKIVTSFTVAHSLTLLLSALSVVRVSAAASEVLIAMSIVYVALENLVARDKRLPRRWLVTFGFGLVHGLGFATELRTRLDEVSGTVLWPVLSFNLGVEVGQVAIVAAVFPLLVFLRKGPTDRVGEARQRRLAVAGSIPIALLGLYWVISRLGG